MRKLTKNTYSKPLLEVIKVDHEISLVMASVPSDDDDNLPTAAAPTSTPRPTQIAPTSVENNPFGGNSPNY